TWRKKIWDSSTGKFLRRTPTSWAKILLFYLCFYTVLGLYFWILWSVFSTLLSYEEPMYQMDKSLIGDVPGMDYWPKKTEYTFSQVGDALGELEEFLEPYHKAGRLEAFQEPCTKKNGYNYRKGQPCVFLKLNRIFGWKPTDYEAGQRPSEISSVSTDFIPLTCEDRDGHKGLTLKTFPPGFPKSYFPFKKQKELNPLVAVWFSGLTNGTTVRVECKAWAPNIEHDPTNFKGSVRFRVTVKN
ncbi:hypothetical protein AAG570_012092, partial [Ranatra chinensis]